MLRNPTLADAQFLASREAKPTRRWRFVTRLEKLVPLQAMIDIVAPHYYNNKRGRPAWELETMLRVHILQITHSLSDPGMEDALRDSFDFCWYAGLHVGERVPDETTILSFRHLLEDHNLADKIFDMIVGLLEKRGLIISKGTIVDGTFIEAPSSTKNKAKARDPEMASGKKGNTWHFGAKMHAGVDKRTGVVHTITVTPASTHDVVESRKLMREDDSELYGDAGYLGVEKRCEFEDCRDKVTCVIMQRPGKRKKMTPERQKQESVMSGVRCKVEHLFGRIKGQFGFRKTPYRGLKKLTNRLKMVCAVSNLLISDCYERRTAACAGSILRRNVPIA